MILPFGDLHRGDVERGRQVDDEAVDLAVLQRRDGSVVRVEDGHATATA